MSISTASGGNGSRNLALVKQYFKKPMMLIVAILSLISLGANFMYDQASKKVSAEAIESLKGMVEGIEDIDISAGGSNTFGYLLSFVVTISLFLIFFTSLMPKGGPTVFFSVLHILSVLQLIISSIAALFVVIVEIVVILSSSTIVTYLVNNDIMGFGSMTEEQIETINRNVASFRITLLIAMGITIAIFAVYLYYLNSQTAFLKSVTLTCKNPQLKSKGAEPYGNIAAVIGVIDLVCIVIIYLMVGNPSSSVTGEIENFTLDTTAVMTPFLVLSISQALSLIVRGTFAKGWAKFAKDNEDFVYETVGAATRTSDSSPMPTFKSAQRKTQDARQQSQPYLIGEEEDPNKKSSYIPEELQNDYPDQSGMYGQQGFGGNDMYGNDMYGGGNFGGFVGGNDMYGGGQQQGFGGNPYGQQGFGGDPYGQPDPFAQSPMGNNPYGQQGFNNNDPFGQGGGQGYNNGKM